MRQSITAKSHRAELGSVVRLSEAQGSFHDRVLDGIRKFLKDHAMTGKTGAREFYEFEKELHARLMQAEREIVGGVMAASDVDADAIEIDGRVHRRVLRSEQTYMTAAGAVKVERWLYKDRRDPTAHALAAMDAKLGIIDGFWTQRAAEQASWVVTQMTPQKAENLFARIGNMEPSKSSLDRLPKTLGDRWEAEREKYEQVLREAIVVPEGAHTIAVSIDGVLAPIDGGASPTKVRADAASEGRTSKGPAGYREMGCATLAFCDAEGDLMLWADRAASWRHDMAHVSLMHGWVPIVVQVVTVVVLILLASFTRRIASVRINVMMRTQLLRQRFLVLSSAERYGLESHLPCVLNAEMSQSADAVHRDHVAPARARIAERVIDGDARAHERPCFLGR